MLDKRSLSAATPHRIGLLLGDGFDASRFPLPREELALQCSRRLLDGGSYASIFAALDAIVSVEEEMGCDPQEDDDLLWGVMQDLRLLGAYCETVGASAWWNQMSVISPAAAATVVRRALQAGGGIRLALEALVAAIAVPGAAAAILPDASAARVAKKAGWRLAPGARVSLQRLCELCRQWRLIDSAVSAQPVDLLLQHVERLSA